LMHFSGELSSRELTLELHILGACGGGGGGGNKHATNKKTLTHLLSSLT